LNKTSVTKKAVRGCNGLRTSLVTGYLTILKVVYVNVTLRNLYYEFIRGLFFCGAGKLDLHIGA